VNLQLQFIGVDNLIRIFIVQSCSQVLTLVSYIILVAFTMTLSTFTVIFTFIVLHTCFL